MGDFPSIENTHELPGIIDPGPDRAFGVGADAIWLSLSEIGIEAPVAEFSGRAEVECRQAGFPGFGDDQCTSFVDDDRTIGKINLFRDRCDRAVGSTRCNEVVLRASPATKSYPKLPT